MTAVHRRIIEFDGLVYTLVTMKPSERGSLRLEGRRMIRNIELIRWASMRSVELVFDLIGT